MGSRAATHGRRHDRQREEGVIIVLFSVSLIVLLAFAALVYTGAQALVLRRQLQNAGDAGALAAANLLIVQQGCSASGSGGSPRSSIVEAAKAAVVRNIPSYEDDDVVVSCPNGYNNAAVKVALHDVGPSYFAMAGIATSTVSTAVNGQTVEHEYAVVLLDPANPNWKAQRNGCPSFLINGGVSLTFEKSVFVNSTCTVADSQNGAVKALNSSFRMDLINGAEMKIGGEYALNTYGRINPDPIQRYRPLVVDPLSGLRTPDSYTTDGFSGAILPTINMSSTGTGICKDQDPCILEPGTYPGGILAANGGGPSTLLLRPGVYYVAGGGLKLKSSAARILAIPSESVMSDAVAKTTFAQSLSDTELANAWQATCPLFNSPCGVMIYNAPASPTAWNRSGGNADQIANGAQGVVMLRAYDAAIDSIEQNRLIFVPYNNLVFWQARAPLPGPTTPQPVVSMSGGACVVLSGTVYAPGALVDFGGSSCGAGGGGDAVTALQFVVWDLTLSGNNDFYFAYQKNFYANNTVYGLVE
ncbi:MAG TPA: pilus assembly protein TadG-related protein [Candidatus Deferrimicrobiaceae bacterium]|nr:pilus assembly protein TadG-related protein [Candidatus Deferrimicrobiaceae bacterium]